MSEQWGGVLEDFQQCSKEKGASSHHPSNCHVVHLAQMISKVVLPTSALLRVCCWCSEADKAVLPSRSNGSALSSELGASHHLTYISDVLLGLFCGLEICSVISGWHRDALGTGVGGKRVRDSSLSEWQIRLCLKSAVSIALRAGTKA